MICRQWRGWTTQADAGAYEAIVRGEVIPGIEARSIPGFRHIDLMRRDLGDEVEFQTLMWFDDLDSIRDFIGEDYAVSHVPPPRRRCWRGSTGAPFTSRCSTAASNRR